MNKDEEEKAFVPNISIAEISENKVNNTPSEFTTTQEWLLYIIPIKTQKSPYNDLDPKHTERVIHSSEAPEQAHKFVQNYISLNLDQVIESKIGPSGFYLKY